MGVGLRSPRGFEKKLYLYPDFKSIHKHMKHYYLLTLAAALAFAGCKKDGPDSPPLKI